MHQYFVALLNYRSAHRVLPRTGLPIGVSHDDNSLMGRGLLGLIVPDIGDQVADHASKQRTEEEDAQDRKQP